MAQEATNLIFFLFFFFFFFFLCANANSSVSFSTEFPGNNTLIFLQAANFEPLIISKHSLGKKDIVFGVFTPVLATMSILSVLYSFLKKLFKKKEKTPEITNPDTPVPNSSIPNLLSRYRRFTYRELSASTKQFHHSQLLGMGRYASVYRSIFRGSVTMYAVKRFNRSASSKFSFEIEAATIYRLQHKKILELRGWCDENPNEPLLLYDYMHNKSLQEALRNRFKPLNWPLRYNIAVGVAEALVYLHEKCFPRVIHADIREGNVMLDVDFRPKLGDFGLAMSAPPYIIRRGRTERDPPECQPGEEVTEKLDVYLYGSMLLALCCGRVELLRGFYRKIENLKVQGRISEVVDPRLNGVYDEEEVLRLLNAAMRCLEQNAMVRPSMAQVLHILTHEGMEEEEHEPIFRIELDD